VISWHAHDYAPHPAGVTRRWCGEYWSDDDDTGAPWGVCWVGEYPATVGVVLWYVLVADPYRRRGIATALVAAARKRWPGIHVTEGVTPAGEALYDSIPDDPEPRP
jgi:GNAT superfamily N-acetyltransferase